MRRGSATSPYSAALLPNCTAGLADISPHTGLFLRRPMGVSRNAHPLMAQEHPSFLGHRRSPPAANPVFLRAKRRKSKGAQASRLLEPRRPRRGFGCRCRGLGNVSRERGRPSRKYGNSPRELGRSSRESDNSSREAQRSSSEPDSLSSASQSSSSKSDGHSSRSRSAPPNLRRAPPHLSVVPPNLRRAPALL